MILYLFTIDGLSDLSLCISETFNVTEYQIILIVLISQSEAVKLRNFFKIRLCKFCNFFDYLFLDLLKMFYSTDLYCTETLNFEIETFCWVMPESPNHCFVGM